MAYDYKKANWMDKDDYDIVNPNYRPGIDPPSYRKDKLKLGEPNPKEEGIDGYEYEEDIWEDYKTVDDGKPGVF
mgnify:FL=1|jgi:hypothetical protein